MKNLFFILFLFISCTAFAQTYNGGGHNYFMTNIGELKFEGLEETEIYGGHIGDSTTGYAYIHPGRIEMYADKVRGSYIQLNDDSAVIYNALRTNPDASYLELAGTHANLYGGGISTGGYLSLTPGNFALIDRMGVGVSSDAFSDANTLKLDATVVKFIQYSGTDTTVAGFDLNGRVIKLPRNSEANIPIIENVIAQNSAGHINGFRTPDDSTSHHYTVWGNINITAISSDVISYRVSFTDINNNSQILNAVSGLCSTGYKVILPIDVFAAPNTTIEVETVLTTSYGSITFDASAIIKKEN